MKLKRLWNSVDGKNKVIHGFYITPDRMEEYCRQHTQVERKKRNHQEVKLVKSKCGPSDDLALQESPAQVLYRLHNFAPQPPWNSYEVRVGRMIRFARCGLFERKEMILYQTKLEMGRALAG